MARAPRCDECGVPMQFDEARRAYGCPECEGDTLDEMEAPHEGFEVHEYDEEDRP